MTTLEQQAKLVKKLIERRKKIGLTMTDLAYNIRKGHPDIKISVATISRIENGKRSELVAYNTLYYWDKTLAKIEKDIDSQKNKNNLANESNPYITEIVNKYNALPKKKS